VPEKKWLRGRHEPRKTLAPATRSCQENRDVADAIAMLAKHLEIDPREVRFNGLKDRRSISYQHVTRKRYAGDLG
jgi:hypothetical protein